MSREDGRFDAARRSELKEHAKMAGYQGKFLLAYIEALEEIARAARDVHAVAAPGPKPEREIDMMNRLFEALERVEWMDERTGQDDI